MDPLHSTLRGTDTTPPDSPERAIDGENVAPIRKRHAIAPGIALAVLCFVLHLSLIAFQTYVIASRCDTVVAPRQPEIFKPFPLGVWSNAFGLNRWDALIYESIARHGYTQPGLKETVSDWVCWFPGYPALVRSMVELTGLCYGAALTLLSALGTLTFWLVLWTPPMRREFGQRTLAIASMLIVAWPGAQFWFAGMTEPYVALATLLVIVCWIERRDALALAVLAAGTAVKQVLAVVGLVHLTFCAMRSRARPWTIIAKLPVAWSGLLLYALFCWLRFGDPAISSHRHHAIFGKSIQLRAFIDFPHLARYALTPNGAAAVVSLIFSVALAVGWLLSREMRSAARQVVEGKIPAPVYLWAIGASSTALYVCYDAYGHNPFTSTLRYQTTNVAHFLLAAWTLRSVRTATLIKLGVPLAIFWIYWQSIFTVRYWNWWWVA